MRFCYRNEILKKEHFTFLEQPQDLSLSEKQEDGVVMKEESEKRFLKLLGAKSTKQILEFLNQHGTAQYNQLMEFVNAPTLNARLRELLVFGLVSHHFERVEKKREWYEITEKGKKVLQHLRAMVELVTESF